MKNTNQSFIKIVLMAFFILLVYFWFTYHINSEIVNFISGGSAVLIAIISFLVQYSKKDKEAKLSDVLSGMLSYVLNYQIIIGLYIFFFVFCSFISSVRISSNEVSSANKVQLFKANQTEKAFAEMEFTDAVTELSRTVFTNPFGRTIIIDAEGYQKSTFTLFPWTGLRINVERDLRVAPTLLFRYRGDHSIVSRLKVKVKVNNYVIFEENTSGEATFIVGNQTAFPLIFYDSWFIETKAEYGTNEQAVYQKMKNWWVVEPLFIPKDLAQGDILDAEIFSRNGKRLEHGRITLNSNEFQEIKLNAQ